MAVTKRVLADPAAKGRILRAVLEAARGAKGKAGVELTRDEALALRYVQAIEKMQAPVAGRGKGKG